MLAPALFTSIPADLLVVLVVVLLFLGPKRLPGLGKSLGSGIREFKGGISDSSDGDSADDPSKLSPGGGAPPTGGRD